MILAAGIVRAESPAPPEEGLEPELRSVFDRYRQEVLGLPAEDILVPGTDSQLKTLLDAARRENPDLRASASGLRSDRELARAAAADLAPRLGLEGDYDLFADRGVQAKTYASRLQLTQALWDGGLWSRSRLAEALAQSSGFSHELAGLVLDYEVARTYFDLMKHDAIAREHLGNVERLGEAGRVIEGMFSAGLKTKADHLHARISLATAKSMLLRSVQGARDRLVELNRLLRRSPQSQVGVQAMGKVRLFVPEAGACLAAARANRPDIKMQGARVRAARAALSGARQSFWPTLSLVGAVGHADTDAFAFTRNESRAMLRLSLPLFQGRNLGYLASAGHIERSELARLDGVADRAAAEVAGTLHSLRTDVAQIRLLKDKSEAAAERLRAEKYLYRNGRLLTTDLMDSYRSFVEARQEIIEAVCDYRIRMSRLRLEMGGAEFPAPAAEQGRAPEETLDLGALLGQGAEPADGRESGEDEE
ncbi:MAG: TolC family protein [Elusimicrobiota bacterium]